MYQHHPELKKYIELKPRNALSKNADKEIEILTFSKKDAYTTPFGSYMYRMQKYPGDLDLQEIYSRPGNRKKIIDEFTRNLIQVVKRIQKAKLNYYSEFKIGEDLRYDVDIGILSNGTFFMNPKLESITKKLYNKKLLNKQEYDLIYGTIKKFQNANIDEVLAYDIIKKVYRERRILRWTAQEVLDKKKEVGGDKYVKLKEAIDMKAHIKVDVLTMVDGKFMEVTNFIILGKELPGGNIQGINNEFIIKGRSLSNASKIMLINNLRGEVEKLFYSPLYYSPFKGIKRMYALSRMVYLINESPKYGNIIQKLIPIVTSDISNIYQIRSEIETILRIFEVVKVPPVATINTSLDQMKNRLSNNIVIETDTLELYIVMINKAVKTKSKEMKIKYLSEIASELKDFIAEESIGYLEDNDLWPIPEFLLPQQSSYYSDVGKHEETMIPRDLMPKDDVKESFVRNTARINNIPRPKINSNDGYNDDFIP
jgi:hypothetical protein